MHRNELRLRQRLARAKGGHKRTMQRRLDAMMAGRAPVVEAPVVKAPVVKAPVKKKVAKRKTTKKSD